MPATAASDANPKVNVGVPCPLCKGGTVDGACSLCGDTGALSPQVARVADAVLEHMPIPSYDNDRQVVASHLKVRLTTHDLEGGEVFDVDDIVEIRLQARITNVSFDVHEPTGELHRNHHAKVLEVKDMELEATPKDW